jgi:hypothetical protein
LISRSIEEEGLLLGFAAAFVIVLSGFLRFFPLFSTLAAVGLGTFAVGFVLEFTSLVVRYRFEKLLFNEWAYLQSTWNERHFRARLIGAQRAAKEKGSKPQLRSVQKFELRRACSSTND